MKFDKTFTIKINRNFKKFPDDEPGCAYGKITIGDFWENFYMSHSVWKIKDYVKQWKLAWKYLETHDTSIFVANVQSNHLLITWPLYKIEDSIYIRNNLIIGESYEKLIGNNPYTPETSFLYILPRKHFFSKFRGKKVPVSEWEVKIIS